MVAGSPRLEAMFQRAVALAAQPKIDIFDVKSIRVGPILTEKATEISTRTITIRDIDGKELELVLHTKFPPQQLYLNQTYTTAERLGKSNHSPIEDEDEENVL